MTNPTTEWWQGRRVPVARETVNLRLRRDILRLLDAYCEEHPDIPDRAGAIRRILAERLVSRYED